MKQYDVKISHAALNDMEQIYSYIADRLLEPDTAMGQYNRILIIRAEPEQEVYLQRLIKIILKLLSDAPGIDRVRIVPLCLILISLICLRFWLFQSCAFGSA